MALSSSSMPRTAALSAAQEQMRRMETRSRSLSPEENEAMDAAMKDAAKTMKRYETRISLTFLFILLMIVTITLAIVRALPEGISAMKMPADPMRMLLASFAWLFGSAPIIQASSADLMSVLAPFLAVSVAIERLLETGFNWFEQSSRAIADILVAPRETLDWIGREYQDAYQSTKDAMETVGVDTTPEKLQLISNAEDRLAKAEQRLRSWVDAPEYLAWKKALAIWFGLLIGLVISIIGDLGMMRYIGIPTPRVIDMVITGLVIGSGSSPMHDLIGILQGGKNALSSLADLAKGKSVKEVAQALSVETTALKRRSE